MIDDLHPKGDEARAGAVQYIVEQRYNREMGGGTFVTSNLSPTELLKVGNYDPKVAARLESRCAEIFLIMDTNDTKDYRQVLMQKNKERLKALLQKREQVKKKTKK